MDVPGFPRCPRNIFSPCHTAQHGMAFSPEEPCSCVFASVSSVGLREVARTLPPAPGWSRNSSGRARLAGPRSLPASRSCGVSGHQRRPFVTDEACFSILNLQFPISSTTRHLTPCTERLAHGPPTRVVWSLASPTRHAAHDRPCTRIPKRSFPDLEHFHK